MPFYEGAALTTITTGSVDAVLGAFHAGAKPAYIREIHLFLKTVATTSADVGLKRSTAIGTGALTGNLGIARDPLSIAALGSVNTAWASTAPTVTAQPGGTIRRFAGATAIGTGIVWTWYEGPGLIVPANSGANSELCLVNLTATAPGTYAMTVIWEE